MKCLYCGEPLALALLKRFTGGGEFCSDGCKAKYQIEFTQLAVGRLQQARSSPRRPAMTPLSEVATPEPASPPQRAFVERTVESAAVAVAEMPLPEAWRDEPVAILEEPLFEEPLFEEPTPTPPPEPEWLPGEAPWMASRPAARDWEAPLAAPVLALADPEVVDLRLAGTPARVEPPLAFTDPSSLQTEPEWPEAGFEAWRLSPVAAPQRLRSAAIVPAPVTVYMQFPLDLDRARRWRPRLGAPELVERPVAALALPFRPYGRVGSPLDGFHRALEQGPQAPRRRIRLRAGVTEWSGLDLTDRAATHPVAMLNRVFPARGLGFSAVGERLELPAEDARYDQFLRPAAREELLERIRRMRRTAPLTESAGTPVTMEEVKPALELLKSIGESLAARPEATSETGALIPMRRPRALSPPPAFAAPAAPAVPPPPVIDPALVPAAGSGMETPRAASDAGQNLLGGLVGAGSQAFLFGSELAVTGAEEPMEAAEPGEESVALAPLESERLPEAPAAAGTGTETKAAGTSFNQVAGFGPPAGGSMNIGTMVVVNQPAGAVTINATPSATAATFEARLKGRAKELGPLENIAEPVGLQAPAGTAAAALPLRMNFAGCLTSATPLHWPALSSAPMRRKFFFGPAPKSPAKRVDLAPPPPGAHAPRQSPPRLQGTLPPVPAPPPPAPLAAVEENPSGGWWKSLSGRFGRK